MLKSAPCGCPPGTVTVKCKHHFTDDPEDTFEVFGRRRCAQRRHRVVDTVLMQPNCIHVAFDDQKTFEVGAAAPRFVQPIQLAPLVEEHGFRRVQVLRLALIEDAPPERNDSAPAIAYWKHDPVAEAVVVPVPVAYLTPVAFNDQSQIGEHTPPLVIRAEAAKDLTPRIRCISDAKFLHGFPIEATPCHVLL